ncbi:MAG: cation:dicarboxylase symporter family transporter [bacterium]|nr:cation:dicarboxylase symporter family transporter [bacterium]
MGTGARTWTTRSLAALAAGILTGLFLGDLCAVLEPFSTAFIRLMQMAVIPYVVVSVVGGIGGLHRGEAGAVARRGTAVLLALWCAGIVLFLAMQFAFPPRPASSLFSAGEVAAAEEVSLVDTFIPANPFRALADGVLPAIVLFSIFLGAALIGSGNKEALLAVLGVLSDALSRVMGFLMRIAPFGIFAVTAHAAGTLSLETLSHLQFYCAATIVLDLLLTFVALPLAVAAATGFRYRDVLSSCGGALVLSFAAQKTFIALPLIEKGVRGLFERGGMPERRTGAYAGILVPIAYNFPSYGDFAPILFVLFAGWLYDAPLRLGVQLRCAVAGVMSSFGSSRAAVPFLLRLARLPEDAFNLYVSASAILGHFGAALTTMFLFSFTALCVALLTGRARPRPRRAALALLAVALLAAGAIGGLRAGFARLVATTTRGEERVIGLEIPAPRGAGGMAAARVYRTAEEAPPPGPPRAAAGAADVDRIRARGALRVGYNAEALPFTYFNRRGDLVGFDAQTARELASFIGLPLVEFVPVDYDALGPALDEGRCDIIMAGVVVTPERLRRMRFSSSYMTSRLAFVVPDHRRAAFSGMEAVRGMDGVPIAVLKGTAYAEFLPRLFPRARAVELAHERDYFEGRSGADALLTTVEEGVPWTLLYPFFRVASFGERERVKFLHAYPVALGGDGSLLRFTDAFLEVQRLEGALREKYDYWVLGRDVYGTRRRWSVVRDILRRAR